eukprot:scaffold269_cov404-Prasinococcus_capsulatus_cf.AAC.49
MGYHRTAVRAAILGLVGRLVRRASSGVRRWMAELALCVDGESLDLIARWISSHSSLISDPQSPCAVRCDPVAQVDALERSAERTGI